MAENIVQILQFDKSKEAVPEVYPERFFCDLFLS